MSPFSSLQPLLFGSLLSVYSHLRHSCSCFAEISPKKHPETLHPPQNLRPFLQLRTTSSDMPPLLCCQTANSSRPQLDTEQFLPWPFPPIHFSSLALHLCLLHVLSTKSQSVLLAQPFLRLNSAPSELWTQHSQVLFPLEPLSQVALSWSLQKAR